MNEILGYEIPHPAIDHENGLLIAQYDQALLRLNRVNLGFYSGDEPDETHMDQQEVDASNRHAAAWRALDDYTKLHMDELRENGNYMNTVRTLIDQYNGKLL